MKPGYKTTEFWLTVISQVVSLLVVLDVIQASDAQLFHEAASNALVAAIVVVGNALVIIGYIKSRTELKK